MVLVLCWKPWGDGWKPSLFSFNGVLNIWCTLNDMSGYIEGQGAYPCLAPVGLKLNSKQCRGFEKDRLGDVWVFFTVGNNQIRVLWLMSDSDLYLLWLYSPEYSFLHRGSYRCWICTSQFVFVYSHIWGGMVVEWLAPLGPGFRFPPWFHVCGVCMLSHVLVGFPRYSGFPPSGQKHAEANWTNCPIYEWLICVTVPLVVFN